MREIKFRYRYEQKGFDDTFQIITRVYNLDEIANYAKPKDCEKILSRDEYTGLKDKNGVEIYEGDIVKNYWWDVNKKFIGHNWVVKFGEYDDSEIEYGSEGIGFYCENEAGEQESPINLPYDRGYGIEVSGNIYENKELLEGD